ncbi:MAG TPA: site-2 protease family protein [Ktedonobacteraceae bacterium]|nr:site-2 protease family protein [Ktedonobacteraceae bacterium]
MLINVLLALMVIASFLLAVALHEFGHATMALWLGDRTPQGAGRLTLNPRPHLDPVGTLMCVLLAFQPGLAIGFGWGKPVKPDPWKMRIGADAGVLTVAWAGILFSLIIGAIISIVVGFVYPFLIVDTTFAIRLLQLLIAFASVNFSLALFNLLPIYPLDGYQIVYTLLPSRQAVQFARSAPYGPFIILAIFFLLPFLGQLSGLGDFPLFRLAYYIWLGSMYLISLLVAPFHLSFEGIVALYLH